MDDAVLVMTIILGFVSACINVQFVMLGFGNIIMFLNVNVCELHLCALYESLFSCLCLGAY